ncbi:MAG: TetR/AcrR family transcriptional regulator [Nocardioides sp.]|uniref:TetR/AcrR family transcriptional regulator n=1 Tax=Nocardioides sp. TaxID=35761 RepID=UPI0039E2C750
MSTSQPPTGEDSRSRLLRAAAGAFAQRGFHGTTTRDIAAAAGMSPAAVYVHHRSKEELLYQISRSGHERTLLLLREAVARGGSTVEQLCNAVREFARHHAMESTSARVVNYELAALTPAHWAEVRELRRQISNEVHVLVERGVADGSFDCPQPRIAATALLSLGVDIARWYSTEGPSSPEELADAYVDIALRIVGAS